MRFLLDANNAAPTCYYEMASQDLSGHQYMHNPDVFGYLQFASESTTRRCKNVFWLSRYVLAQLYQAEVQYLQAVGLGDGRYTTELRELLRPEVCTVRNGCNATGLLEALKYVEVAIRADEKASGTCVRYEVGKQKAFWTGGPCFEAHVSYTIQRRGDPSKRRLIRGSINEAWASISPRKEPKRAGFGTRISFRAWLFNDL